MIRVLCSSCVTSFDLAGRNDVWARWFLGAARVCFGWSAECCWIAARAVPCAAALIGSEMRSPVPVARRMMHHETGGPISGLVRRLWRDPIGTCLGVSDRSADRPRDASGV
jgi:hypothetical protein